MFTGSLVLILLSKMKIVILDQLLISDHHKPRKRKVSGLVLCWHGNCLGGDYENRE